MVLFDVSACKPQQTHVRSRIYLLLIEKYSTVFVRFEPGQRVFPRYLHYCSPSRVIFASAFVCADRVNCSEVNPFFANNLNSLPPFTGHGPLRENNQIREGQGLGVGELVQVSVHIPTAGRRDQVAVYEEQVFRQRRDRLRSDDRDRSFGRAQPRIGLVGENRTPVFARNLQTKTERRVFV